MYQSCAGERIQSMQPVNSEMEYSFEQENSGTKYFRRMLKANGFKASTSDLHYYLYALWLALQVLEMRCQIYRALNCLFKLLFICLQKISPICKN